MITITDKAAAEILNVFKEQEKEDHMLRIFIAGMGCSGPAYGLALEKEPKEEDEVLEANGIKVVMDKQLGAYMDGAVVDFIDNDGQTGFTITNPNIQANACSSCGSSCED
ncbi:MAG: iron-sulfur cluster assembly accessory protein [Euryarchaeota archaeon]|nr:iron-sulfur cluster assembly accessory protein [Euryarchaeota archaeon]